MSVCKKTGLWKYGTQVSAKMDLIALERKGQSTRIEILIKVFNDLQNS